MDSTGESAADGASWLSGRGVLNSFITFFVTLLLALMVYMLHKIVKAIFKTVSELFLFWTIALSGSSHNLKKPLRLHAYLCETSYLDEVGINELYHFYQDDFYSASGMTAEDIHKLVMRYTHVLMCRDRIDGTLRGSMLIGIRRRGDYTQIELGRTTFKNHYRGSPFIKIILTCVFFGELFRHPLTPIYVVGKCFSYKSYLVGMSVNDYHPVYNKETPERFKKIFAEFALLTVSAKGEKVKYNPERFVVEQEDSSLTDNLSVISEQDLQNPHIKFFVESNPGWRQGHCLVTGFLVTWPNLFASVTGTMRKVLGVGKKRRPASPRESKTETGESIKRKKRAAPPKLLRRHTFQELSANTYAVNNLEYDIAGEVVLSPTTKAPFVFQTVTEESEVHTPGPTEFNVDLPSMT